MYVYTLPALRFSGQSCSGVLSKGPVDQALVTVGARRSRFVTRRSRIVGTTRIIYRQACPDRFVRRIGRPVNEWIRSALHCCPMLFGWLASV